MICVPVWTAMTMTFAPPMHAPTDNARTHRLLVMTMTIVPPMRVMLRMAAHSQLSPTAAIFVKV